MNGGQNYPVRSVLTCAYKAPTDAFRDIALGILGNRDFLAAYYRHMSSFLPIHQNYDGWLQPNAKEQFVKVARFVSKMVRAISVYRQRDLITQAQIEMVYRVLDEVALFPGTMENFEKWIPRLEGYLARMTLVGTQSGI
jgi:hypothetical protein